MLRHMTAALMTTAALAPLAAGAARAADNALEEVSVTATRLERPTAEVPQAVSVVGADEIESEPMTNITDALDGVPGVLIDTKNGGYDARVVIRGAGVKARYGVREIMVLQDGVPMTDPDSFSRFDMLDLQEIERIEVAKGPANIYAPGSVGGAVQIITKSAFDRSADRLKVSAGTEDQKGFHLRKGAWINDSAAVTLTASHRESRPDWRRWNEFRNDRLGIKAAWESLEGDFLEADISYTDAAMQIPGDMSPAQFAEFQRTGEQKETQSAFKHSSRDSRTILASVKYERTFDDLTLKPRAYVNRWEHFHPVTGAINENPGNWVLGTDLEAAWNHDLGTGPAVLNGGLTLRTDVGNGQKKYQYADVNTVPRFFGPPPLTSISATLSDAKGALMEETDEQMSIVGLFAHETVPLAETVTLDAGARIDKAMFSMEGFQWTRYDYGLGNYFPGDGAIDVEADFLMVSPRVGVSWDARDDLNLYGSVARGEQVPSMSELESNTGLEPSRALSYEVGAKLRRDRVSLDAAAYWTQSQDEITRIISNGDSVYMNAGEVLKRGMELSGAVGVAGGVSVGGSYAFSHYEFQEFAEPVRGTNVSRAGNRLPYVPMHQWSLHADWQGPHGLTARIETRSWGEYYMDNANSQTHSGYDFLTDVSAGWKSGPHQLRFNVQNLFDKRYAAQAEKGVYGNVDYDAGRPRTLMLTYALDL